MSGPQQQPETPAPVAVAGGEEKSRLATLGVQLFVIPLAVLLFCVALGGLFVWLTAERRGLDDYLNALRASSGERRSQQAQFLLNYIQDSKRWQGIFDFTAQISADREKFLAENPRALTEISQIFEESRGQDPKTRRYLALVLGLLGDPEALPVLRNGLSDPDPETVKNCLWALGRIGDEDSALRVVELSQHSEQPVRLMAVYVLGTLRNPQARAVLRASVNDPDELVQWNAAFGLANQGDAAARDVLLRLLDNDYVIRVTQAMPRERRPIAENIQRYRVAAVVWLAKIDPSGAVPVLQKVSTDDADLQVRNAAIRQLKELNQK